MLGVFLVSAVVHEYIFCFVLGFFYPVMLLLFLVFGGELSLLYAPVEGDIPREESWRFQTDGRGHVPKTEAGCACLLGEGMVLCVRAGGVGLGTWKLGRR